jgi:hypothetical protein
MMLPTNGSKDAEKPNNSFTISGVKGSTQDVPGGIDNYKRY